MTAVLPAPPVGRLPTHKDLPESDGTVLHNFAENPQSALLNGTMAPVLARLFPDGQYVVGNDSFIYWKANVPEGQGCKAPDWFVVTGVPPMLNGEVRRSYVIWDEGEHPLIVIEYVSGDGEEERDRTSQTGKFWVYERGIVATYYVIHDGFRGTLEVWRRDGSAFRRVEPNGNGRFPVPDLEVELGLWRGTYNGTETWYVRPWDIATGEMLPSWEDDRERLAVERERAEVAEDLVDDMREEAAEAAEDAANQRRLASEAADRATEAERQAMLSKDRAAEAERQATLAKDRAARLAEMLRKAGIDPEAA